MNELLKKLMLKKKEKGETMSEPQSSARSSLLEDLINDMMGEQGDKVKGLKKVTVASTSPKGLEHGLDKAKELVGHPDMLGEHENDAESEDEESPAHEATESNEEEAAEGDEHESPEDLKAQIELLKQKLAKHNLG